MPTPVSLLLFFTGVLAAFLGFEYAALVYASLGVVNQALVELAVHRALATMPQETDDGMG